MAEQAEDREEVANILALIDEDENQGVEPEWVVVDEICVMAPAARYTYALAFGKLESRGFKPFEVKMNPLDFTDFRVWEPPFDEQECDTVEGCRGSLWGKTIVTTTLEVPAGTVVITGVDAKGDLCGALHIKITR
jgi:hypothetical protein